MADTGAPKRNLADTFHGKILIGIAIAAGGAAISWFVSRATYVPPPPPRPTAVISPSSIVGQANTPIQFSADGSFSGASNEISYLWRVGGFEASSSPVARCTGESTTLTCRFALPGTFAVAVEVIDKNGMSHAASSTVTVSVPGGYLGLMLRDEDEEALSALLYDVDWISLQQLVQRPIVLTHPIRGLPVYAAFVDPPEGTPEPPPWRGAAAGRKVAIPPLPPDVRDQFEVALLEIGATPTTIPFAEVYSAVTMGAVDAAFVLISAPGELAEIVGELR